MIIAVGYRTNSKKATKFRQWATGVLKSYLIKGYSINKEKLKKMKDWVEDLDVMLKTNRYEVLDCKGKISAEEAKHLQNFAQPAIGSAQFFSLFDSSNFSVQQKTTLFQGVFFIGGYHRNGYILKALILQIIFFKILMY